jgi:hypothetical protein
VARDKSFVADDSTPRREEQTHPTYMPSVLVNNLQTGSRALEGLWWIRELVTGGIRWGRSVSGGSDGSDDSAISWY